MRYTRALVWFALSRLVPARQCFIMHAEIHHDDARSSIPRAATHINSTALTPNNFCDAGDLGNVTISFQCRHAKIGLRNFSEVELS